jgi:hypothetical protein
MDGALCGGTRTPTPKPWILSPLRLPFRHAESGSLKAGRRDLNPQSFAPKANALTIMLRPALHQAFKGADGGIRTHILLIDNQTFYPLTTSA